MMENTKQLTKSYSTKDTGAKQQKQLQFATCLVMLVTTQQRLSAPLWSAYGHQLSQCITISLLTKHATIAT